MFIVYAPNVASGGGLVLLRALILSISERQDVILFLDRRGRSYLEDAVGELDCHWFKSSVTGRLSAELALRKVTSRGDIVLCFHSLPPVFRSPGQVICYVHNANLVDLIPPEVLSPWVRFRNVIERQIAHSRKSSVVRYVVQTPTMERALAGWYGDNPPPIDVLPFIGDLGDYSADKSSVQRPGLRSHSRWDFVYVSDGSAHKNHRRLIEAWSILAKAGHFPTLALTLAPEPNADLCKMLDQVVAESGAKIDNLGALPHPEVLNLYADCGALIFPSLAESFGVPLIEATRLGLPIVASERTYVRDMCVPSETFDPESPSSIAHAVDRFLGRATSPISLLDGPKFFEQLAHQVGMT